MFACCCKEVVDDFVTVLFVPHVSFQVPDESQLTPAAVLSATPAALRACGLSERKASYLQDLAAHFQDGRLSDELLTSKRQDHRAMLTLRAACNHFVRCREQQ